MLKLRHALLSKSKMHTSVAPVLRYFGTRDQKDEWSNIPQNILDLTQRKLYK